MMQSVLMMILEAELVKEKGLWLPQKIFGAIMASTKIRLLKTLA